MNNTKSISGINYTKPGKFFAPPYSSELFERYYKFDIFDFSEFKIFYIAGTRRARFGSSRCFSALTAQRESG